MFVAIENLEKIEKYQADFSSKLEGMFSKTVSARLGYRNGVTESCKVLYKEGFWWSYDVVEGEGVEPEERHWNGFGVDATKSGSLNIVVEINFPLEGINRRVAGCFAQDEYGDIYIMHSGKIGGGGKGIGKDNFIAWHGYDRSEVMFSDGYSDLYYPVAKLKGRELERKLVSFVISVDGFKSANPKKRLKVAADAERREKILYTPEYFGTINVQSVRSYTTKCTHGLVVKELMEELEMKVTGSHEVCRTQKIDVLIKEGKQYVSVYEVKTSSDTQSVYTAIGQLMLHSEAKDSVGRFLVLPLKEVKDEHFLKVLSRMNIKLVEYTISENECQFTELGGES